MARAIRDRFANVAAIQTTTSAADTETFAPLATNMGFLGRRDQALAMVIDEIQWSLSNAALALLDADGDQIHLALTTSNLLTDLTDLTDQRILANFRLARYDGGTAASMLLYPMPAIKQYFPPLITAERTLFLGVDSASLGAVITAQIRILYRVETLTSAELIELAETFRLTG